MYLVPNRFWKFTRHTSLKTDFRLLSIKTYGFPMPFIKLLK